MPFHHKQKLEGHTDRIWTLAWNPAGTVLASSGGDKSIRLWAREAERWVCISILTETHSKSIRRVCWSPCGQYIASASFDATVSIWRQDPIDGSWTTVVNLDGHENEAKSVAWSSDGRYLASCGRDKTVWIWERTEDNETGEDNAENWDCADVKNDHTKDVKHIVWHPHHNILVSCSYDDTVKFFHKEGDDWKCFETLASHTSTVWSADFSPSGEYLVTCSDDKTVRVWKNNQHNMLPKVVPNSWKCVSTIQGYHNRTIYDVAWCKITDTIVSASGDNSLAVYAIDEAGEMFNCIDKHGQSHECDVNAVSWNQKEPGLLASGGDDCFINLWTYNRPDEGMRPKTIAVELEEKINEMSSEAEAGLSQLEKDPQSALTINLTDYSTLMNLVRTSQCLQNELVQEDDYRALEKLLDLKFSDRNQQPVKITDINYPSNDGFVDCFTIIVNDNSGNIEHRYRAKIDTEKFKLHIPRRSSSLIIVANEIFVIDKTGDMFKILPSGQIQFLLGHLFSFTGVRFMTNNEGDRISFVVSSDRDEKIRISNYPDTFNIERFGFGHKQFLKSLTIVDDTRFVSVDEQNEVCLWDLTDLKGSPLNPLRPKKTMQLLGSSKKRVCSGKSSIRDDISVA